MCEKSGFPVCGSLSEASSRLAERVAIPLPSAKATASNIAVAVPYLPHGGENFCFAFGEQERLVFQLSLWSEEGGQLLRRRVCSGSLEVQPWFCVEGRRDTRTAVYIIKQHIYPASWNRGPERLYASIHTHRFRSLALAVSHTAPTNRGVVNVRKIPPL